MSIDTCKAPKVYQIQYRHSKGHFVRYGKDWDTIEEAQDYIDKMGYMEAELPECRIVAMIMLGVVVETPDIRFWKPQTAETEVL